MKKTAIILILAAVALFSYPLIRPFGIFPDHVFSTKAATSLVTATTCGTAPQLFTTAISAVGAVTCTQAITYYIGGPLQNTTYTTSVLYTSMGASGWGATENLKESAMSDAVTCRNLRLVTTSTNGAGTGTITLRKGSAPTAGSLSDTALTFTVASGATQNIFSDVTHSVAFAAGDSYDVSAIMSANTSGTNLGWSMLCSNN